MARVDGAGPQVVRSSSSPQTERVAAQAGGEHNVVQGDTLAKLAKEAYGDPSKWTLIRDANAGKVKMRGDIPIIQIGAKLTIPPAPQGWGATGAGQRKAVPAQEAPVAQQTQEPQNAGQVYGNARKNLDAMEFQLKGLPAPLREQMFSKLAKGEDPGPQFKGAMEATGKFVTDLKAQAEKLPPDQQQNLQALLERDQGQWPLANRALEAMSGGGSPESAAPLTSEAIARAQQDGLLEVRELGHVVGAIAKDLEGATTDAAGESAIQQLSTLLQTAQIPPEQAPAFQQALGQLQQLANANASPEEIAQFARQLEALPPMRGGGVENVPFSPLAPSLQQAVTNTVRDGQMNMLEFSQVLRALSVDARNGGDQNADQVMEQGSALMMYLTQNAKIPPGQELAFIEAAQEFGRLASAGANPRDIERLADRIERDTLRR